MTIGAGAGTGASPIRIGARRSPLAVSQAQWVADALAAGGRRAELIGIVAHGDVDRRQLTQIGGTGVFAAAVRERLLAGDIDLAVHSLKDLPIESQPGLILAGVPAREDARDVLIGVPPDDWRDGTVVGTGSPRRAAQLVAMAQDRGVRLRIADDVRGNVGTRLNLVRRKTVDATVLAAAGLRRLGLLGSATTQIDGVQVSVLSFDEMLPAAGQGALAIEARSDAPQWLLDAVAAVSDPFTLAEVTAERATLATLEAGCLAPVGILARADRRAAAALTGSDLTLSAVIAQHWTRERVHLTRRTASGGAGDALQLGVGMARRLLTDVAPTSGAGGSADVPAERVERA